RPGDHGARPARRYFREQRESAAGLRTRAVLLLRAALVPAARTGVRAGLVPLRPRGISVRPAAITAGLGGLSSGLRLQPRHGLFDLDHHRRRRVSTVPLVRRREEPESV